MNDEARTELDRILALTPPELSESDRAFLQARRSYMTEEQRINFGISDNPVVEDSAPNEATDESQEDQPVTPSKTSKPSKTAR